MTSEEKIEYIIGFIQRLQEIVATADLGDDCKRALPRFHKCEQNLIRFLAMPVSITTPLSSQATPIISPLRTALLSFTASKRT